MTLTRAVGALVVAALAALLVVPALHYAGLNMDEGDLLVYPELVLRGAVPYRDFLMSYGPGNTWLLASLFSIFGPHVAVERLVGISFHVLLVVAVFAHASRWGSAIAVLSGVIAGVLLVPLGAVAFAIVGAVALVLWSLFALSTASGFRAVAFAGALAGLAVDFRPDLGPATVLAAVPLALGLGRGRLIAFSCGAVAALLPFGLQTWIAGPAQAFNNLVIGPLTFSAAGLLPLPGRDPMLLVLVLFADAALIGAAVLALWAEPSQRSRTFVALAVFSTLRLPYALWRADDFHLVAAGTVPLALLPVTALALVGRRLRLISGRRREFTAALIAALVIATGVPENVGRAATIELPRALGLQAFDVFSVQHRSRVWYPLRASVDYTATPVGSRESAAELQATIDDAENIAPPGARLFVGPLDLRRTNQIDAVIYHLLPQFVPATYYLEAANGWTNGLGSRLSADIGTADVLILTSRYDNWSEPNASQLFGSDEPNAVVRDRFELRAQHGTYSIYIRRVTSLDPGWVSHDPAEVRVARHDRRWSCTIASARVASRSSPWPAEPMTAPRTSRARASPVRGCGLRPAASSSNAQVPATCGVAIEVPLMRTYRGGTTQASFERTSARAEAMPVPYPHAAPGVTPPPVAMKSGFRYRTPGTGPREL